MATVEDVVVAALARCGDLGIPTGGSRSPVYRRATVRQQQLFSAVARQNPEYFGEIALGTLVNGAVDIDAMLTSGVPECEAVYRLEIGAKGTSTYTNGQAVTIASVNDALAAVAPRVTIQNRVIRQVGTDLAGVTSVRAYYSRRPAVMDAEGDEVDLPSPFEECLVIDLVLWFLRQSVDLNKERKESILPALQSEATELEAALLSHVLTFTSAFEGRFGELR